MTATSWLVQGVGDFDGDGKADILWRNDDLGGIIYTWLMNGTTISSAVAVTGVGTVTGGGWVVKSIGDYNGDGKADVFWKKDTALGGITYVWLMNGTTDLQRQRRHRRQRFRLADHGRQPDGALSRHHAFHRRGPHVGRRAAGRLLRRLGHRERQPHRSPVPRRRVSLEFRRLGRLADQRHHLEPGHEAGSQQQEPSHRPRDGPHIRDAGELHRDADGG